MFFHFLIGCLHAQDLEFGLVEAEFLPEVFGEIHRSNMHWHVGIQKRF
jgi:hypothetical protein